MKLYIAGPMTGVPDFNYPAFRRAEQQLTEAGFFVISPVKSDDESIRDSMPYEFFLKRGIRDLLECEGVAFLPDWNMSRGATLERHIAVGLGLPVASVSHWLQGMVVT